MTTGHRRAAVQPRTSRSSLRAANNVGMSDSMIFLFGAVMYLIGLGAMLFKDEFARLSVRLRRRS